MKNFTLFILALSWAIATIAQQDLRYRNLVFESASRKKNLYYGSDTAAKRKSFTLDIYSPDKDTATGRPLIILTHGGGFKFGSKNNSRMKIWGKHFARMGYVCAAVNYRLSKKKRLSRFNDLVEGCMDAVADVQQAIRYLKSDYARLGVDTTKFILGGHSAGGMIALQAVYSSPAEMRHLIEPAGNKPVGLQHNPSSVIAVINYWGAVFDTTWLSNTKVPIVSVHGSKDRVVPINYSDNPMFGSAAIHRQAGNLHIRNALKVFEGKGHELQRHFNPLYAGPVARKRWRQAADFTSAFLYETFFISRG